MLRRLDQRGAAFDPSGVASRSSVADDPAALAAVREIIDSVRARGDEALRELTARFDGCRLDDLRVPAADLDAAPGLVEPEVARALEVARDQIEAYHRTQLERAPAVHQRSGVRVRELVLPVDRAGLYVPGGRAAYPSTVLMTAVPARVAGVGELAVCVPPGPAGRVPAATLLAARMMGIADIFRVGGAQAIAALAYGTETISPVDVIVGPGNRYVALAKREVAGVVGIDSLAGPSELVVVADDTADPELVALDLMAQAEHGPDGGAVLVSWLDTVADAVDDALDKLVAGAARRQEIEATFASGGRSVLVDDADAAMQVANAYAPEHLELVTATPDTLLPLVRNAAAVFVGRDAPAVLGDYLAGPNHVLPTGRAARFSSALRVDAFRKHVNVVDVAPGALDALAPHVEALAATEGLDAHREAIARRVGR